ncbi:DNA polymerase III subunit delta' [Clostridium sp. WILCCON 0269]|uniref:DNA polymerase III subunit delta' n=1 Tax=Candidatus Clostridium eludens TaxID=3381663 RepID=A0ABW8SHY0_9CLOT
MSFYRIIGHDMIKLQIANSINLKRFSHANILVGENGLGKSLFAKEIAMEILGKSRFKQYADIIEINIFKGRKSIGIEEIKHIIEEINKKPYESDKKVVILYSSDKMTEAAQNALLKTIEEPPAGSFIMLLCEKLDGILDTIKSRCQIYKLNRLNERDMKIFLNNKFPSLSKQELKSVMAFSDGIPGRAEKFISDTALRKIRNITVKMFRELYDEDINFTLEFSNYLLEEKDKWEEVLTCMLSYIRDVFVYKETGNSDLIINMDKFEELKAIGEMFSFNKLNAIINIIENTREKLDRNVNSTLVFDSMLMKMREV